MPFRRLAWALFATAFAGGASADPPSLDPGTMVLESHDTQLDGGHAHTAHWTWRSSPPDGTSLSLSYYIHDHGGLDAISAEMADRIRDSDALLSASGAAMDLVEIGTDTGNIHIHNDAIDGAGNVLGQAAFSYGGAHGVPDFSDGFPWHRLLTMTISMDRETWYTGTGAVPGGQFDYWSVMLHEMGHGIGLGHADVGEVNSIMTSSIGAGVSRRVLTADDQQAIAVLYGVAGVPEPATWALFGIGMGLVGYARRRRETAKTGMKARGENFKSRVQ